MPTEKRSELTKKSAWLRDIIFSRKGEVMGLTIKAKEMIRFLEYRGFWLDRTNKHHIFTNGIINIPVSKHDSESLKFGTLRGILNKAGIPREDLEKWLAKN